MSPAEAVRACGYSGLVFEASKPAPENVWTPPGGACWNGKPKWIWKRTQEDRIVVLTAIFPIGGCLEKPTRFEVDPRFVELPATVAERRTGRWVCLG